jgi:hypothetical protein
MLHRLAGPLLLAGLLAIAASLWMRHALPEPHETLPALQREPLQVAEQLAPFTVGAGGVTYTVRPLYRYEIHGLVVSRHDTAVWWDVLHRKDWNDHLNVVDLCLIWGPNLRNDAYRAIRFWSEVFTCNAGTDSSETWARFDENALSNNHLLASDGGIVRLLRRVRPGDQIVVRGYLAEYAHDHGRAFRRGTSTVRTDRGNGACETIWVTEATLLREANRGWRALLPAGVGAIVLAVLLGWFAPLPRPSD